MESNKTCQSFAELVLRYVANKEYRVQIVDRSADITIIAIHGGAVEPLASELAQAIAGSEHNLYDFQSLDSSQAAAMRVPALRYSEMRLNALVRRSRVAVAIDGVPGEEALVHIGGKNAWLKRTLTEYLKQAGFSAAGSFLPGAAHDPTRYYNTAQTGGVLIELSAGLRAEMTSETLCGEEWRKPASWQASFFSFVSAVRAALLAYAEYASADLEQALQRFEDTTRQIPKSIRTGHHHGKTDAD